MQKRWPIADAPMFPCISLSTNREGLEVFETIYDYDLELPAQFYILDNSFY